MEELLELHEAITKHRYNEALTIVEEMTAVAKKDIINKIGSYISILLLHCIKSYAEKRMSHSWETSILEALAGIRRNNVSATNKGVYLDEQGFSDMIDEYWSLAVRKASTEAFGSTFSPREFAQRVDADVVKALALDYILNGYPEND